MWEYSFVIVPDESIYETVGFLNSAGAGGWEFTGYTQDTSISTAFLMKRVVK